MIRKKLLGGKLIYNSLPLGGLRHRQLAKPIFALGMIVFSLISLSIVNTQDMEYLEYNALLSAVLYDYAHDGGPHLIGDNLLITYAFDDDITARQSNTTGVTGLSERSSATATDRHNHAVGVAFHHENYAIIHPMQYNKTGLYFVAFAVEQLYQNIPLNTNTIYYRVIVNGTWTHDHHNPDQITDHRGFKISAYELPLELKYGIYPVQRDGEVHFVFAPHYSDAAYISNTQGQRVFFENTNRLSVTIAGSFNGWDPYLYAMLPQSPPIKPQALPSALSPALSPKTATPSAPYNDSNDSSHTVFAKSLSLPPGEHYYYFVINGTNVLDPHNQDSAAAIDGRIVSRIVVQ